MRHLFVLIMLILSLSACKGEEKTDSSVIYNKEFKWTITIPAGFKTVSADKLDKMQQRGMAEMEQSHNVKLENHAKNIFIFQNDQFNYFESNYQPFDSLTDGDFLESFKMLTGMLYETFQAKVGENNLDSVYSIQTVSGLEFQSIKIAITLSDKVKLNWYLYSRLFGKKQFTVNIMTMDPQKEKELLKVWTNSKFGH